MNVIMFLTKDEELILEGESGSVLARAMKLIVTIGDLKGAERLVAISRSQIAGVSYKTSGDPTLELMESLADEGVKVRTHATQNPAGMDLERWKDMKVSPQFAMKQLRICNAYKNLGIKPICTCTPYLSGNRPKLDEIVGFSESSAVAYVNSVIGARTNRHGGLDALSCALVGKVPLMGLLLNENRSGSVYVDIEFEPNEESDYAAIGYYTGKNLKTGEIPVFTGLKNASSDRLKLLGAAAAAAGSVGLFHVLDVTAEAKNKHLVKKWMIEERLNIDKKALKSVYDELSITETPDLVCLGCPHCSVNEVREIAKKLEGRKVKRGINFWVYTSPNVYDESLKLGYVDTIRSAGGDVFRHTCMVVSPLEEMGFEKLISNSAKACFYVPRMTKGKSKCGLASQKLCVDMFTE
jgi:predicted aconitase